MVSGAVTLITLLAEVLMVLLCLHAAFGKKFKFDWATIGIVLVDIVLFMLVNLRYIPQVWMAMIYISLIIYCFLEFELSIGKTLICYIMGLVVSGVLEGTIQYTFYKLKIIKNIDLSALLSSIICLIGAGLIYRVFYRSVKSIRVRKSLIVVTIIYGFVFGVLVFEYYRYCSNISLYFIIILVFLVLGYIYLYMLEQAQNVIERKTLENEMQSVYGKAYQELLNEVRRRQHDFKNQIGAILSMQLIAESLDDLKRMQGDYLEQLSRESKYDAILVSCNNPILAGYVYSRCLVCEQEGIGVEYEIKVDQASCAWGIHELIETFGILIDNACEHILNENLEKKIEIFFLEDTRNIIISISNPAKLITNNEMEKLFVKGYSTKGENRGIGLSRVLELVQKYDDLIETKNRILNNSNWIEFKIIIHKK